MAQRSAKRESREEEPLGVAYDFGVVYSLYQRPGAKKSQPRLILKISWEDEQAPADDRLRSSAFELDLDRERLIPLGRKGNSLPVERFSAKWFCDWAKKQLPATTK